MSINIGKSKKENVKFKNKGFNRAQMVQAAVAMPASAASIGIISGMRKVSQISKADSVELAKAVQEGLKNSGLYEKGVRIYKVQEVGLPKLKDLNLESLSDLQNSRFIKSISSIFKVSEADREAANALTDEIFSNKLLNKIFSNKKLAKYADPNYYRSVMSLKELAQFKMGINACYLPNANKIITPNKSLQTSVFHEIGHALNANGNVFLKALQKMRPMAMILPGLIFTASILNKNKVSDGVNPDDSKVKKGAYFVKKHAGLLAGLSFAPMVLEEGLASLRGQGVAKKLVKEGKLSKAIFKKVKLTNLGGFSRYCLAAVAAALSIKVAVVVKDKIQARYEEKKLAKFEK